MSCDQPRPYVRKRNGRPTSCVAVRAGALFTSQSRPHARYGFSIHRNRAHANSPVMAIAATSTSNEFGFSLTLRATRSTRGTKSEPLGSSTRTPPGWLNLSACGSAARLGPETNTGKVAGEYTHDGQQRNSCQSSGVSWNRPLNSPGSRVGSRHDYLAIPSAN